MTKITLVNTNCSWNKGSAAQVLSVCESFRSLTPDIDITLISHYPELDSKYCEEHNIEIVSSYWWRLPTIRIIPVIKYRLFFPLINVFLSLIFMLGFKPKWLKSSLIKEYLSTDLILDLSGDSYSDSKGGFSLSISSTVLLAKSLNKPIVLYSQSIGKFNKYTRSLNKYCLNKVTCIIVREEISFDYLNDLGVSVPIYPGSDCAFLLRSASKDAVDYILDIENIKLSDRKIVGVSVNVMFDDNFAKTMAEFLDYIIENYKIQILFVPHVVSFHENKIGGDCLMSNKILNLLKNKDEAFQILGNYSPIELKGIISNCDFFIGGRMHANIAAISSNVPTLAISWSHKYIGIMKAIGQEKFVCDFKNITQFTLREKFDRIWSSSDEIRHESKMKIDYQIKLAWSNCHFVTTMLSTTN